MSKLTREQKEAIYDKRKNGSTIPELAKEYEIIEHQDLEGLMLQSDQGWQYQMEPYHRFLKEKGINHSCQGKATV